MISVNEAKGLVKTASKALAPAVLSLSKAVGLVLAQDVVASIDLPPFHQADRDGYAFAFEDYGVLKKLEIQGEIPAGSNETIVLRSGQATRIFTGGRVPPGADTVVMQEHVTVFNKALLIKENGLQKGAHVRPQGSEIRTGTIALQQGTFLSPAALGFLAALGTTEVSAYPTPAVAVIVTGNELQLPGTALQASQVYESNACTLQAALQQLHITNVQTFFVRDDLKKLQEVLQHALKRCDVVLLTGGVSVGTYDFVVQAAEACGVETRFHNVAQRPGKPLFFGTKESKLIFGLPGNPASVLTCFYQYVVLALEALLCRNEIMKTVQLPLATPYKKKAGLTHFLKGRCDAKSVTPLPAQESYKLVSFASANCLITLDEAGTDYKAGDLVAVHLIPFG